MTVAEKIVQRVKELPESLQVEVLNFVECLQSKVSVAESCGDDEAWWAFSLSQAVRGVEREPSPYSADDIKEAFT